MKWQIEISDSEVTAGRYCPAFEANPMVQQLERAGARPFHHDFSSDDSFVAWMSEQEAEGWPVKRSPAVREALAGLLRSEPELVRLLMAGGIFLEYGRCVLMRLYPEALLSSPGEVARARKIVAADFPDLPAPRVEDVVVHVLEGGHPSALRWLDERRLRETIQKVRVA